MWSHLLWGERKVTPDEKIDGLDAIIEDLVEWELEGMNMDALANHYLHTQKKYYHDNPTELEDMLKYRKDIDDWDVVIPLGIQYIDNLSANEKEVARQQDNDIVI